MVELKINITPNDYGTVTGQGQYEVNDDVTIKAIPKENKVFKEWLIIKGSTKLPFKLPSNFISSQGFLSSNVSYTFKIATDTTIIAVFRDKYIFNVNVSTYPYSVGSVYTTAKKVVEGESITLKAREEKGYTFSHWSNGKTENPLTIENIDSDINLVAFYKQVSQGDINAEYHAFIKDQLALNSLPKAIITVLSFTIKRDLMTTANSSFEVLDIPSNLNIGDILALYSPAGNILYYGVISTIENNTIETNQMQAFYSGKWVYDVYPSDYLETEIQYLLDRYAQGYQKGATYQDKLMYQEKKPLLIKTGSKTQGKLETKDDKTTEDMEDFIYSLYEDYNLVLDFQIPYGEWKIGDEIAYVLIKQPSTSIIKIGTNAECIEDMSPVTKIEETNKLIIYSSKGEYRKTYIATATNGIVEEPDDIVGRFGKIETKIVYSDDELDVIKEANIKSEMFNHKVEFTLLLDNNLYDFWTWELGQTLQIYNGSDYYNSVFTGYELTKNKVQTPTEVKITAGKVRTALTKILTMSLARRR